MTDLVDVPWMGQLMDISAARQDMETLARKRGETHYGVGCNDDIRPSVTSLLKGLEALALAPHSWAVYLDVATVTAVCGPPERLRGNLVNLAALTTAWIEDLDRRAAAETKDKESK